MFIGPILKALGINIDPETVAKIEKLLPQIPDKINGLIQANGAAIKHFDERLAAIEKVQAEMLACLKPNATVEPALIPAATDQH